MPQYADWLRSNNYEIITQNKEIITICTRPEDTAETCSSAVPLSPSLSGTPNETDFQISAASNQKLLSPSAISNPVPIIGAKGSAALPHRSAASQVIPPDPHDFIAVEGWPQKKPCIICGRKYTNYQERMTPERLAGPPRANQMLCTGCYEAAQVRVAMSLRTIPGVIDSSAMHRRSTPNGRCGVCHTGPAIWSDPLQQITLCETCYQREQASAERGA